MGYPMLDGQFVEQRGCQREEDLEFVLVGASILDHCSIVNELVGNRGVYKGGDEDRCVNWRESTK